MHNDKETKPSGLTGAIFWIAIAFSCFQLVTAAFSPLSSQVVRAIHVGFVILLVFACTRRFTATRVLCAR